MTSIRTRLSLLLLLAALLAALAAGLITYRQTLRANEELFDYQLRQIALSLRDQGVAPIPQLGPDDEPLDVVVQIWKNDGTVLYFSQPGNPIFTSVVLGFTDVDAGNRRWRVFGLAARDRVIEVAQPLELRRDLAADAALRSLAPLLIFAPMMACLIWWLVGHSLLPLRRLADEIAQRDAHSLAGFADRRLPEEIAPMVNALNALLERLRRAFASQRAFVADAAHELRSPMTALKLQLQLLARAPDAAAREQALVRLHDGVDRATHLIEQLLTAAQTDPNDRKPAWQDVDLAELMRQAIADVFVFAQARRIDIAQDAPEHVMLQADPASLRILARNLLDNAIRYTPEGGAVHVTIGREHDKVILTIEDSGPGIPEQDRERVFDRFYRHGAQEQNGSGLGLAIVKNVVEQHGAEVALATSAGNGLKVDVIFPARAFA